MATISDFQAALQAPAQTLADPEARIGSVALNAFEQPISYAGNNAITYRIDGQSRSLALRCFHRAPSGLEARYETLTGVVRALRLHRLPWCQFSDAGVYAGGSWNPVVLMPWVSGDLINDALAADLDPDRVAAIRSGFRAVVADMVAAGISHGDLQHGNLLVDGDYSVRVVDFDTMHTPGMPLLETSGGHPNYQHPGRPPVVGPRADRFAVLLIDLALHALELRPWLWRHFDTGENLLFVRADLMSPSTSPLIRELKTHPDLHGSVAVLESVLRDRSAEIPSLLQGYEQADEDVCYINALDRAHLLGATGAEVAVVGRPYNLVTGTNPRGVKFAFANFGRRSEGAFALKAWADRRGRLPVDVKTLARMRSGGAGWVIVRGRLVAGRGPGRIKTPEIRVADPSQVSVATSELAASLLEDSGDKRAREDLDRQARDVMARSATPDGFREQIERIRTEAARIGLAPPLALAATPRRPTPQGSANLRAAFDADVLNRLYGDTR